MIKVRGEIVYGGIWCDGGKPSWETWMTAAPLQCSTFSLFSKDKAGNESSEKTGRTNKAAKSWKEWKIERDRPSKTVGNWDWKLLNENFYDEYLAMAI